MLDLELLVSTALNFEYQVHHPDWPLEGFYLDMQVERQEQVQRLFNSYEQCSDLISIAYNSDLPLLCTPSQIALSLLYMQDLSFMNDYINSRFENQNIDGLLKMITSIIEIIKNVKVTSKESASRIAKLNDQCFSREYLKTSKLYKQKHEREIVGKEEEDVFQ
ncbi:hypothetical protein HK103_002204 [Boothiomyces macroporosus]|uniref:Cyclin C-terminal domain-containing protein n=1 Tax=Boothiomyces macroporosus TaxID=261099 RepID=A0AAD5Y2N7_9FUNG|nr:hypothetical protein HK103_002204 [Boothiomyces macroporosus]